VVIDVLWTVSQTTIDTTVERISNHSGNRTRGHSFGRLIDFAPYRSTDDLDKQYLKGKWREGTQRNLVAAVLRSGTPRTLDSLVKELDGWPSLLGDPQAQRQEW
jgi:hypothetical protein